MSAWLIIPLCVIYGIGFMVSLLATAVTFEITGKRLSFIWAVVLWPISWPALAVNEKIKSAQTRRRK